MLVRSSPEGTNQGGYKLSLARSAGTHHVLEALCLRQRMVILYSAVKIMLTLYAEAKKKGYAFCVKSYPGAKMV
jgi:hypothetical protein